MSRGTRMCKRCSSEITHAAGATYCPPCGEMIDRVIFGMIDGGWFHPEIAAELGITHDAVSMRVSRARRKAWAEP